MGILQTALSLLPEFRVELLDPVHSGALLLRPAPATSPWNTDFEVKQAAQHL